MFNSEIREPMPPIIHPWKVIKMNPDFSGQWLVAGDLDNDGILEFVTARNDNQSVTALSAYKLDGTMIWKWGKAGSGEPTLVYDVPMQIYDINSDGRNEILFSEEGFLVILDGLNGNEIERYPLPDELSVADCITFANLNDIIIKTRYTKLWAYTLDWRELWNWSSKDGFLTCHHPTPIDLDGDGKDEILAGYTMLDDDGSEIWTFDSKLVKISNGHLDCCRVVEPANKPDDFRFIVTCCGAGLLAFIDGLGNTIWEKGGHHFESADAGKISSKHDGKQIFVDIDHRSYGDSSAWLINSDGDHLGTYLVDYCRHHKLVDWNGDGFDEIVLANALTICDGLGNRIASFDMNGKAEDIRAEQKAGDPGPLVSIFDISGNGNGDVVLHTNDKIFVYLNQSRTDENKKFADMKNFTLY